ncbi:MAG: DUF3310 domain-containing protein [Deltaproteobacteria bacterium]|nr:DUF3310 domain-containing protein [Deltaproteobacteria bacterium]
MSDCTCGGWLDSGELDKNLDEQAKAYALSEFVGRPIEPQTLPPMTGPVTMQDGTVVTPHDPVQRPTHYQQFGVEVIDIIRHVLGPEGFRAYCIGNELKYRLRAGDKGDAAQDIAKAMKYREFREGK